MSRRSRVVPFLSLFLGLAGCLPQKEPLSLDVSDGPLAIALILRERGVGSAPEVRAARVVRGTTHMSVGPGERLATARIPLADLRDPAGRPLAPEMLAGVEARLLDEAPFAGLGGCNRCLAPSALAPVTVYPGDLCTLPGLGRLEMTDGADLVAGSAQDIFEQVQLAWPGSCPVCPEPSESYVVPDVKVIWPRADLRVYTHSAVADSGAVIAASTGAARLFDEAGADLGPLVLGTDHGELQHIAPLSTPDGTSARFLLVSKDTYATGAQVEVLTSIDGAPTLVASQHLSNVIPRVWAVAGDKIVLLGSAPKSHRMAAASCKYDGALHCAVEEPCQDVCPNDRVHAIAGLAHGLVAVGVDDFLLYRGTASETWSTLAIKGARAPIQRTDAIGGNGEQVWLCSTLQTAPVRRQVILTGTLPPSPGGELLVREIYDAGSIPDGGLSFCGDMFPPATGRGTRMHVFGSSSSQILRFSENGLEATQILPRGLGMDLSFASSSKGAWLAGTSRAGAITRSSADVAEVRHLARGSTLAAAPSPALALADDGAWVLGTDRQLRHIEALRSAPQDIRELRWVAGARVPLETQAALWGEFVATTPDRKLLRAALLAVGGFVRLQIQQLDPKTGEVSYSLGEQLDQLPQIATTTTKLYPVRLVAPWVDAAVIAFRGSPVVVWERRTGVRTLPIEVGAIRSVAGGDGVAWVIGSSHLARIRAVDGRLVVDPPLALEQLPIEPGPSPARELVADAGYVECPDSLVLLGVRLDKSTAFRLCSGSACPGGGGSGPRLAEVTDQRWRLPNTDFSDAFAFRDVPIAVHDLGLMAPGGERVGQVPFIGHYQIVSRKDYSLISGPGGWLGLVVAQ